MKKINFKKIAILLFVVSLVAGCNINAIPTFVSKDVSFGVITVNNLQDKGLYAQEITLDLSSFISDDQFDAIETAKFKKIILTLNADYKNTVTNSEDFNGIIAFLKLKEGVLLNTSSYGTEYTIFEDTLTASGLVQLFKKNVPVEFKFLDGNFDIKNLIKDKKVKIGVVIGTDNGGNLFNDNAFSFTAKVETEVLVVQ